MAAQTRVSSAGSRTSRIYSLAARGKVSFIVHYILCNIRRPWPSPRPGRRLGPPEVWILSFLNPCHAHTAGKRHHKATAMAQEHPTAAAMASFIGCRLRSLKPSKPSNSSKSLPNSAGKRHPTAAAMASFIGVQGCHLPGLKGSKRSTPSTSPPSSAGKRYPNKAKTRHSRMQNAQLRRQASVVRAFKPAVCQASNP